MSLYHASPYVLLVAAHITLLAGCIADERLVLVEPNTPRDMIALDMTTRDDGSRDADMIESDFTTPDLPPDLMDLANQDLSPPAAQIVERGGLVVIEAERYDEASRGSQSARDHQWAAEFDSPAGSSKATHVIALPNNGVSVGLTLDGPRMSYDIELNQPGSLYVWVRLYAENGNDNSVHVGLDGEAATLERWGMRLTPDFRGVWAWTTMRSDDRGEERVVLEASREQVRVDVWMREDGVRLDKIILARDPDFTPDGVGPEETLRDM